MQKLKMGTQINASLTKPTTFECDIAYLIEKRPLMLICKNQ